MTPHTIFDWSRQARTGIPEVVYAESKSVEQVSDVLRDHISRRVPMLLTRLTAAQIEALAGFPLEMDKTARTASYLMPEIQDSARKVAIVTAGTSDLPVAKEVNFCAHFLGLNARIFPDIGVAGLWRLEKHLENLSSYPLIIAVAGMEGALFSVLAGLVKAPVIAVPTSVGYGVSADGHVALSSALASCAPGVVTVNIDNGFGAAVAAKKMLDMNWPDND